MEQDFAALAQARAKIAKPIRAIFVLTVQNGRATVAGANTSADAVELWAKSVFDKTWASTTGSAQPVHYARRADRLMIHM